jgi:RNA polymerase sigma-70 factor (ECF subfamily)
VSEREHLTEQFEEARPHLLAVAYRILGSASEAEDAVQETWLRLAGSDADAIRNLGGWLTTVVGRVCLDRLRARRAGPEELLGDDVAEIVIDDSVEADVELAEGVGLALLVVLETLTPAERLAFVLHDMFAVPFEDIGEVLGRSPAAARQLASRARRRVRGKSPTVEADLARQRDVVDAFLAASREGDFERLIAVLDPDVMFRVHGVPDEQPVSGAASVARRVLARGSRLAPFGRFAIVDGGPGVVVVRGGRAVAAVRFGVASGRVSTIDVFADPKRLRGLVPVRPKG